jgi:ABC-2 type transport system permease protein
MSGTLGDALRMEWVRVLTVRSTFVLAGCALLIGGAAAALMASLGRGSQPDPALAVLVLTSGADLVPLPFAATFMGVLGVLSVGHDYRFGLSRVLLTAQPHRSALLVARLAVLAVVASVVAVTSLLVNGGIGLLLTAGAFAPDGEAVRSAVGYVALTVLWSWLGAATTWLLRATVPALTVLLMLPLVVEPLLQMLALAQDLAWLRPITRWLPFAAGRAMAVAVSAGDSGVGLGRVEGGCVFAALVLAVLVPAWVLFRRRDA